MGKVDVLLEFKGDWKIAWKALFNKHVILCPHGDYITGDGNRWGTMCEDCVGKPIPNEVVVAFRMLYDEP